MVYFFNNIKINCVNINFNIYIQEINIEKNIAYKDITKSFT